MNIFNLRLVCLHGELETSNTFKTILSIELIKHMIYIIQDASKRNQETLRMPFTGINKENVYITIASKALISSSIRHFIHLIF